MPNSHPCGTSLVPGALLDSVSLCSKKWHLAVVSCLSSDDGHRCIDSERRLDEPAGEEIDRETLGRIPIGESQ